MISLEAYGFDEIASLSFHSQDLLIHEVDPLLNYAAIFFSLLSNVASLVQKVHKSKTNSFAIISQALKYKIAVEQWKLSYYF